MSALEQERINQYLQDLAGQLDDLPPQARRDELLRIRLQIERNLQALDGAPSPRPAPPPTASPAVAARLAPAPRPLALSTRDVEWLGVCAGLAEYWRIDPVFVRVGAVALGLLTGPFALIAYIGAYSALSVQTPQAAMPRPRGLRAIGAVAMASATALFVFLMAQFFALIILQAHGLLMEPMTPSLGHPWNWFVESDTRLFFWTLLWAAPLALLGALPLAGQWGSTLSKVSQAVVALFGIVCAFGIACLFVGALLQVLPHLTGVAVAPEIASLP